MIQKFGRRDNMYEILCYRICGMILDSTQRTSSLESLKAKLDIAMPYCSRIIVQSDNNRFEILCSEDIDEVISSLKNDSGR